MKGKSILGFVLVILSTIAAIYLALNGIGDNNKAGVEDINLGLDLEGGVSITYTTVKEDPEDQEIKDTIFKLQKRLDEKGYTEGEVYQEGKDRINVDIPGAQDANKVLEELGKPGKLEFIDEAGNIIISGQDVKTASVSEDASSLTSRYNVVLELNDAGSEKFAKGTEANVGRRISIIYNDEVLMAPTVSEPITGGIARISGLASVAEAGDLSANIRIGALPLELKELRSNVVGAKMGYDAINTSIKAGLIGMVLIFLIMILYYRILGFSANIALTFYAALMIIIISLGNITLTLPGIAGIILSIGMAVDANVIIFTRIKEELTMEKTLKASIKAGFSRALPAILDGNITTFIVAIVLFIMGTGTIKGFAITLGLGIVVSMFTSLFITRILVYGFLNLGVIKKGYYGIAREGRILPIIEKKKVWFIISIIVIAIGLIKIPVNVGTNGEIFNYDIEFAGGSSTLVSVGEGKGYDTYEELEADLLDIVKEATGGLIPHLQNVKGKDQIIIKTVSLTTEQRIDLENALMEKYNIGTDSIETENISATVSNEMKRSAVIALIIAAAAMLLYISIRFKDYRFGTSAVIALLHDVFIMVSLYALLNIPVNNSFIAAILTIVGYSINDTIVIFDRIRENHKHMKRGDYKGVINASITQTISRSINTSLTTFIMVFVLYIIGVDSIKEFALPLMVGIVAGTYSSIFIASPLWYLFKIKEKKTIKSARSS